MPDLTPAEQRVVRASQRVLVSHARSERGKCVNPKCRGAAHPCAPYRIAADNLKALGAYDE